MFDGRSIYMNNKSMRQKRKQIYENMHLMNGMTFTPISRFPQMQAITEIPDFESVPYTDRNKHTGKGEALHFFSG